MFERQRPAGAAPPDESTWNGQRGIEGIEVALISGLIVIIILGTIPLAASGVQAVISSVANELMNAGNAIN